MPPVVPPNASDMRDQTRQGFTGLAGELYRELDTHRPELRELVDRFGDLSCAEYGSSFFAPDQGVSTILAEVSRKHAEKLHGPEVAAQVSETLRRCSSICTGEHAAFLGDAMQFQSALQLAAGAAARKVPVVVSVPFGNVPLDNSSTRSGCVPWQSRLYRFTRNKRDAQRALVFGSPALTRDYLASRFDDETFAKIAHMFPDEIFDERLRYLGDQFAVANRVLWKRTLGDIPGIGSFVQIPAEELVTSLLAESFERRDLFHQMIFEPHYRKQYLQRFEGIRSCHRDPRAPRPFGTHFFWGRSPKSGRQIHYFFDDHDEDLLRPLVASQGRMVEPGAKHDAEPLRLTAGTEEEVLARLQDKNLVPSVFLSLSLLATHGATNNGGYQQTEYFKQVKRTMVEFLRCNPELDDRERFGTDRAHWQGIRTDGFCLGPLFLKEQGAISSLDSLWSLPPQERHRRVFEALNSTSFWQAVRLGATQFYASIVQDAPYSIPELLGLRAGEVKELRTVTD